MAADRPAIVQVPNALANSRELSQRAKVCYMALAANGWEPHIPTEIVAELMGTSWVTAQRALKDLERGGWITQERLPGRGDE